MAVTSVFAGWFYFLRCPDRIDFGRELEIEPWRR
jgi:hypothetical protein